MFKYNFSVAETVTLFLLDILHKLRAVAHRFTDLRQPFADV